MTGLADGMSLGRDCSGQEIIPVRDCLEMHTNRHPNCDGTSWGWIEGCTLNICWSDNSYFDHHRAMELVRLYNARRPVVGGYRHEDKNR